MNKLTLCHGDKGGVGKSFTAAAYLDWRMSTGAPVVAIESDTHIRDIKRLFDGHLPVFCTDLSCEDGWIDLANEIGRIDGEAEWVASLPGGVGAGLSEQMDFISDVLDAYNMPLRAMWVLGKSVDSIAMLGEFRRGLEQIEAPTELVIVKNLFWTVTNPRAFDLWQGSKTRKAALAAGATEIELPALTERVSIDAPPSALLETLHVGDRLALVRWTKRVAKAFSQLDDDAGAQAA